MAVALPIRPPLTPMLARLARTLPEGGRFVFEPK
jgi:ATP-dependent DNA ligase